jgi:phenylacetate-CoA ligase
LHINTDHVYVEIVDDKGAAVEPGKMGRVIVTDLINYAMPFIRYEIGDYAVVSAETCSCGRNMPLLEKVVGRVADFLITKELTKVAGVSLIERTLTKIQGVKQMQIIQNSLDDIMVNIVPDEKYSQETDRMIVHELQSVFKGTTIDIKKCRSIAQDGNGKYRFSICNVTI